ncbi:MAG: sigma-70 family RNA polymerase sigma factor [Bacteroidota bacterium]
MEVVSKYHITEEKQRQELLEIEAAKKSPAKFEVLYNRYHEQIFRYVYQRVDDKDSAFDITQQVFLKALTKLDKYEYKGVPFSSWLYRIAKSETYEALRQNQKLRAVNIDDPGLSEVLGEMGEKEERLEELYGAQLADAIAELDEEDLQLVEMRFFEKRAFKEIGEILEITENNAKVKLYRVIDKLRKMIVRK